MFNTCVIESILQREEKDVDTKKCPFSETGIGDVRKTAKSCPLCGSKFVEFMEFRRHKKKNNLMRRDMALPDISGVSKVSQQYQDSINMTDGVEEWVKSWFTMDHMISAMRGRTPSLRLDSREK